METQEKKNGLGIAALVLGILGFLTAFIGIGIILDIVAIILGIIAIASKKQKSGLGIAGVIIAGVSLLIMIVIGAAAGSVLTESANTSIQTDGSTSETSEEVMQETATSENSNASAEETEPETTAPVEQNEPFETELSCGHYTSGIDFPSGVYNITHISGSGNVSTSNMFSGGLNEVMGDGSDGFSISEFNNAKLEDGVVLSIGGTAVINISSESANIDGLVSREQPLTENVELKSGNYVAGQDFPSGVYDVIAVSGTGNVSSSNMFSGGLNEVMGTENSGFSVSSVKNVNLSDGTELLVSGTTIELQPSK